MKLILSFIMLLATSAFAVLPTQNTAPSTDDLYAFNRFMGSVAYKRNLGTLLFQGHNTAYGVYDFTVNGGAIGTTNIGITLPGKSIIRNVFFDVITQPTSGGSATISFKAVSTGDLKAALAISSWTVGEITGIPVFGTVSTYIKVSTTTTPVVLSAAIATAALTAGKIGVYVDYVVGQ